MDKTIIKNLSLAERTADYVLDKIVGNKELERIRYLKCKLGIQVFIYTAIYHVAFMMIRINAYGVHLNSSVKCTLFSCLTMVGIPFITLNYFMPPTYILKPISFLNFVILFKYAPAKTNKNAIGSPKKKMQLKKNALAYNLICVIVVVLIPSIYIKALVAIGSFTPSLMTVPVTYKILCKERQR